MVAKPLKMVDPQNPLEPGLFLVYIESTFHLFIGVKSDRLGESPTTFDCTRLLPLAMIVKPRIILVVAT